MVVAVETSLVAVVRSVADLLLVGIMVVVFGGIAEVGDSGDGVGELGSVGRGMDITITRTTPRRITPTIIIIILLPTIRRLCSTVPHQSTVH